ncbi:MAG: hypothetical protein U1A72_16930 [Sulfuritalea sp.]|nr:hypothetical protein [Sulfuritalea sp.]
MKHVMIAGLLIILATPAAAQDWSTIMREQLETTDEARQRHGAERWQEYERRGRQEPLGGYREQLGDPAPRGTVSPGYRQPAPRYEPRGLSSDPSGSRSRRRY